MSTCIIPDRDSAVNCEATGGRHDPPDLTTEPPRKIVLATSDGTEYAVLPISLIRLDGGTQARVGLDLDVVEEYADHYRSGRGLSLLEVYFDGTDHWLVDGFHRWHAARQAGIDRLQAKIVRGTVAEARWRSFAVNQGHGLRRSNADKAKVIRDALRHPNAAGLSDVQIAKHVGATDKTVAKYRAAMEATSEIPKSETRTGKDGRTINVTKIGRKAEEAGPLSPDTHDYAADRAQYDACRALLNGRLILSGKVLDAAKKVYDHASPELRATVNDVDSMIAAARKIRMNKKPCSVCGYHEVDDAGECLRCRSGITCPECGCHDFDGDGDCSKCRRQGARAEAVAATRDITVENMEQATTIDNARPDLAEQSIRGDMTLDEDEAETTVEPAVFNVIVARARIENAIFAELANWPDDEKHEAADLLEQIARELRQ